MGCLLERAQLLGCLPKTIVGVTFLYLQIIVKGSLGNQHLMVNSLLLIKIFMEFGRSTGTREGDQRLMLCLFNVYKLASVAYIF